MQDAQPDRVTRELEVLSPSVFPSSAPSVDDEIGWLNGDVRIDEGASANSIRPINCHAVSLYQPKETALSEVGQVVQSPLVRPPSHAASEEIDGAPEVVARRPELHRLLL